MKNFNNHLKNLRILINYEIVKYDIKLNWFYNNENDYLYII